MLCFVPENQYKLASNFSRWGAPCYLSVTWNWWVWSGLDLMKCTLFSTSGGISSSSPICESRWASGSSLSLSPCKTIGLCAQVTLKSKTQGPDLYKHSVSLGCKFFFGLSHSLGLMHIQFVLAGSWLMDSKSHSLTSSNCAASQKQSWEKDSGVLNLGLSMIYYHFYLLGVSLISARVSPLAA